MLRLHDTASGRVQPLEPREPGKVGLYVCGPTVYDVPHIGHARFSLVYDVLRRYLEWMGIEVRHVSNVTDIDDKIIRRANEEGRSPEEIASEFEEAWWQAMDTLGIARPTDIPHATGYLQQMIKLISGLVELGVAYETSDGVYLSTAAVEGYGLLAHQDLESLQAGARVDVAEEKRAPSDFALWKKAKPGEPTWESPWGPGRPGWHTECVAMSLDLLGDDFDLHGGGQDLIFPHHENERAQAVALGRRFARHWVHNGMVMAGSDKMSKSLGNFTTLEDLVAAHDPRAYRLLVLQSHYRSPLQVDESTLVQAENTLHGLDALARRFGLADGAGAAAPAGGDLDEAEVARFRGLMDDDLDTPRALAGIFDVARRANAAADRGDIASGERLARTAVTLLDALGLELRGATPGLGASERELITRRDAARDARDFALADELRDELVGRGWAVEDTPAGTRVHRAR